jgi:hypothetical protein
MITVRNQSMWAYISVCRSVASMLLLCMTAHLIDCHIAWSAPVLIDPNWGVELYADFNDLGGRLKAFGLTLTNGEQGFAPGLYATSGPAADTRSDRLVRVDGKDSMTIVKAGLKSNEQLVFSRGEYPNGAFISIPLEQRIVRLRPDGSMETFASGFTPPFGPSGLWFDDNGILYTADNSTSNIVLIYPDGSTDVVAHIPPETTLGIKGGFGGGSSGGGGAGTSWLVGTFSAPGINPPGSGAV